MFSTCVAPIAASTLAVPWTLTWYAVNGTRTDSPAYLYPATWTTPSASFSRSTAVSAAVSVTSA